MAAGLVTAGRRPAGAPAGFGRHPDPLGRPAQRRHRPLPGIYRHPHPGNLRPARKSTATTALRQVLAGYGLKMIPLGFNNNYAIGMRRAACQKWASPESPTCAAIPSSSSASATSSWTGPTAGPDCVTATNCPRNRSRVWTMTWPSGAWPAGALDATDLYTTDADIDYYDFCLLIDDLHFFSQYRAIILYRADLEARLPRVVAALQKLAGQNQRSGYDSAEPAGKKGQNPWKTSWPPSFCPNIWPACQSSLGNCSARVWQRTKEHLFLVLVSLTAAILLAVPLGILAAKRPRLGQVILSLHRYHPDHPLPGPAGLYDPFAGHWRPSGHRGAVPLFPPAHRPEHLHRPQHHFPPKSGLRRGPGAVAPGPGSGSLNCPWPPGKSWPASRPPPSSTSAPPLWAPSSAPAATASRFSPASA